MFEKVRERVVYPSSMEYQKSDLQTVKLDWVAGYLKQLSDKYPGAWVDNWMNVRVVSEVSMTDQEILEEKLQYVKSFLQSLDNPDAKAILAGL